MANSQPRRVFLWSHPRSLSTVFELSLASRPKTKVFHELYSLAYFSGDDNAFEDKIARAPGYTMKYVIETLESDYPGRDVILCKDGAFFLGGDYDRLPKGYYHTFLIRDPRRSIASLCEVFKILDIPPYRLPSTGGLKQLYDLNNYVTNTLNQKSIIIDAGDLANQPEKTIRKYCEAVEIPYCDSYLNWKPNNIDHWHTVCKNTPYKLFYSNAVRSTHFTLSHDREQDQAIDNSAVPRHGQLNIEAALPYYNELFEKRLRP